MQGVDILTFKVFLREPQIYHQTIVFQGAILPLSKASSDALTIGIPQTIAGIV